MKPNSIRIPVLSLLLMLPLASLLAQLGPGDILFTGYNADGDDGIAFVCMKDIAAQDTIRFTDEEWDGSSFGNGEGDLYWYHTATTPMGMVVTIDEVSKASPIASIGTAGVVNNNKTFLSASNEELYAYTGALRQPSAFLSALANDGFSARGVLTGTGLVEGSTAFDIGGDEDIAAYVGPRTGMDAAATTASLMDPSQWITQDGGGNQHLDGTAPDVPFDATPFSINTFSSVTHTVTNAGNSFVPETLYIQEGDSVYWSITGNHNVNGSLATYPNNPEGFYSGPAPQSSFGHLFQTAGAYSYQCDPHAGIGMTGYIEVQGALNPVSNLTLVANNASSMNIIWSKPSGVSGVDWDGVAVFMSESPFSSFFTHNAQEFSNYNGSVLYGSGTMVSANGSNNGYCIYNSTANADGYINVDSLNPGTRYYVAAFAYRSVASANDDVSSEEVSDARTNTLGSALQKFCPKLDSVKELDHGRGKYRAYLGPLAHGDQYRVRWMRVISSNPIRVDSSQIRSRKFRKAPQGHKNFNVAPWFNSTVLVWLEVDTLDGPGEIWANPLACNLDMAGNGFVLFNTGGGGGSGTLTGSVIDGNISSFTIPCNSQVLTVVEQTPATCPDDSVLLRAGYAGGTGTPTYLWSNGTTTKRAFAAQGETLSVSVTDQTGCTMTDSITASTLANTSATPANVGTTRSGTVVTVTWDPSNFQTGQSLIGYRVQYRLRNTVAWTSSSLTTNTTASVDFAGGTPGNYQFSVIARYNDNGTPTTSARACFALRGVPFTKNGNLAPSNSEIINEVYPNPVDDILFVAAAQGSLVQLTDLLGRVIVEKQADGPELRFDLSELNDGAYIVHIADDRERSRQCKVIKN